MRYLIYTPPVIRFFYHYIRSSYPRGFLFSTSEDIWHPERLSAAIKSHTKRTLGFSIRHRQWRHIAIALDRRLLQGVGCQVYDIASDLRGNPKDTLDSNLDSDQNTSAYPPLHLRGAASSVHHWQAAHTTNTNINHYGNSSTPFGLLTDTLLADYYNVSRQFHQLAHV